MMKKNKLYTVNKYNKPMFMPQENLFDGLSGSSQMSTPQVNWSNPLQRAAALGTTAGITSGWSSMVDTTNPFAPGNLSNALGIAGTGSSGSLGTQAFEGLASTAGDAGGSGAFGAGTLSGGLLNLGAGIAGGLAKSAISGGLSSGAGDAIGSLGSTVGGMVGKANPILGAAINFGSGLVGGVINKAFGTSVDEKKLAEANANISKMNSFTSNAGSFDEIQGPEAVNMDTDAYSGGWFSGSEARRKNRELKNRLIAAKSFANRSVENNIFNLQDDQMNNALANYSAFGGPIYNDMDGAIEYGFMSDYLTNKRQQAEQKNQMTNMFAGTPSTVFDFGGDLQTNSADYSTGLTVPVDNTRVANFGIMPIERKQNFSDSEYFWDAGREYPAGLWRHKDGTFHTTGASGKDIVLTQEEADSIIRANKAKNRRERLQKAMENHKHAEGGQMSNYAVGQVYDVSEAEANRLKAMGYEFTVVS